MKTTSSRVWRYAPLILWMGFIFFASTNELSAMNTSRVVRPLLIWLFPDISEERIRLTHFLVRKAAHFTEYAVLGLLAARAFWSSKNQFLRRSWFMAGLALVVCYALFDEYHQSFVPSRSGSLFDCLIDVAGGLFALICAAYIHRRKNEVLLTRPVRI